MKHDIIRSTGLLLLLLCLNCGGESGNVRDGLSVLQRWFVDMVCDSSPGVATKFLPHCELPNDLLCHVDSSFH